MEDALTNDSGGDAVAGSRVDIHALAHGQLLGALSPQQAVSALPPEHRSQGVHAGRGRGSVGRDGLAAGVRNLMRRGRTIS